MANDTSRKQAIEECAALMDQWADDAIDFDLGQSRICRNAAQAIRNLAHPIMTREQAIETCIKATKRGFAEDCVDVLIAFGLIEVRS